MTELDTNRFNYLVTTSLNTSPAARECHDEYFVRKKFFKYAHKNNDNSIRYAAYMHRVVGANFSEVKIVLDTKFKNNEVFQLAYHELAHVPQLAQAIEGGFRVESPTDPVYGAIATSLVWEAQAYTVEMEGPLSGFFRDISEGNLSNIEHYKEYFANNELKRRALLYSEKLFSKKFDANSKNWLDSVGYEYISNFHYKDDEEKKAATFSARKTLIADFFKTVGFQNNPALDHYIGFKLDQHKLHNEKINNTQESTSVEEKMQLNFYLMNESKKNKMELKDVLATTDRKEGVFMPVSAWHEVLKGDTNQTFVENFIKTSIHKNKYYSYVENKASNGYKHVYSL